MHWFNRIGEDCERHRDPRLNHINLHYWRGGFDALFERHCAAEDLLRRSLPMLERLGDFTGNGDSDPERENSLGSRCDLILDIKGLLER